MRRHHVRHGSHSSNCSFNVLRKLPLAVVSLRRKLTFLCLRVACRIIPHCSTFLNQERWKDTLPPGETNKGDLRVREATPAEKAEAAERAKFLDLLRANPSKSEAEVHAMMR